MGFYNLAQICINGHIITSCFDTAPELRKNFCSICGAKTITHCSSCNAPIHGKYEVPDMFIIGEPPDVDSYCYNCGEPYPWTEARLQSAELVIKEEDAFDEALKYSLISSLPDVISETPKTNLAIVRMKKALLKAGSVTAECLRQFIIDFGCELIKSQLGL